MKSYDPDKSVVAAEWLHTDEREPIELVSSYHRRRRIRFPNAQLHTVLHVIVANQLALAEEVVVK